jgi:hypothetical protein
MTTIKGCSVCQKGKEQYEVFYSDILRKKFIQYDYKTSTGKLFSCVAPTLEECRSKLHKWLVQISI